MVHLGREYRDRVGRPCQHSLWREYNGTRWHGLKVEKREPHSAWRRLQKKRILENYRVHSIYYESASGQWVPRTELSTVVTVKVKDHYNGAWEVLSRYGRLPPTRQFRSPPLLPMSQAINLNVPREEGVGAGTFLAFSAVYPYYFPTFI